MNLSNNPLAREFIKHVPEIMHFVINFWNYLVNSHTKGPKKKSVCIKKKKEVCKSIFKKEWTCTIIASTEYYFTKVTNFIVLFL